MFPIFVALHCTVYKFYNSTWPPSFFNLCAYSKLWCRIFTAIVTFQIWSLITPKIFYQIIVRFVAFERAFNTLDFLFLLFETDAILLFINKNISDTAISLRHKVLFQYQFTTVAPISNKKYKKSRFVNALSNAKTAC